MASPQEQINSFLTLCSADKELRNSLKPKNNEEITQIAASKGFTFSVEQFEAALNPEASSEELTDSDLELVAGGARRLERDCARRAHAGARDARERDAAGGRPALLGRVPDHATRDH